MNPKLLLIDAHAILHRAYHALPPLTNKDGMQTNAVYGFVTMLLRILDNLQPTHLAVAFDLPQPTFRKQQYVGYQAKRPVMQSNLAEQIPLVHELLEALKIPYFEMVGFEADDVIGTIATQMSSQRKLGSISIDSGSEAGMTVVIVTGDRDMLQLINDRVKVAVPVKGLAQTKIYDPNAVMDEFGVTPSQWVDVKALKGDSSDNYPGVPGIGPKTAQMLISKYSTLENLYGKLGELGKLGVKLAEGAEMAGLSKKLATIITNAPVHLDLEKAAITGIDWNSGIRYMRERLGFKSIPEKIEAHFAEAPRAKQLGLI